MTVAVVENVRLVKNDASVAIINFNRGAKATYQISRRSKRIRIACVMAHGCRIHVSRGSFSPGANTFLRRHGLFLTRLRQMFHNIPSIGGYHGTKTFSKNSKE